MLASGQSLLIFPEGTRGGTDDCSASMPWRFNWPTPAGPVVPGSFNPRNPSWRKCRGAFSRAGATITAFTSLTPSHRLPTMTRTLCATGFTGEWRGNSRRWTPALVGKSATLRIMTEKSLFTRDNCCPVATPTAFLFVDRVVS